MSSKDYEIGRKRALAEIERKMAAAMRARKQQDNNQNPEPGAVPDILPRTPLERLGVAVNKEKLSDVAMTNEANERNPFMNAVSCARALPANHPSVRSAGRQLLDASRHNRRRAMARLGFPEK